MKFLTIISIICVLMILPISVLGETETNSPVVQTIETSSFVSKWNTSLTSDGSSSSTQIALPLVSTGTYDFVVNWGDGSTDIITSYDQSETTHTYSSEGEYTLIIDGTLYGWQFNNSGDRLKIIEISQWGNIRLGNNGGYFYGCENLMLTATDSPDLTGTTTLYRAFDSCYNLGSTGYMDAWDVSGIINMSYLFTEAYSFNQPLDNWDVSSVTNMSDMFRWAFSFNQSIGNWNVSSVTDMGDMFKRAKSFNQSIGNWDVSSVTDLSYMFSGPSSFNQPLDNWDVSTVTDMNRMFYSASSFNQSLENWDVSSVTTMYYMFSYAGEFNQPLSNWDVSSVTDMYGMFAKAYVFNQPLEKWDVSSVTDMSYMFYSASSFNQPLDNWDVSTVTDMSRMFSSASSFNQPLDNWDVSSVTDMSYMLSSGASSFNQPLGNWDVSSVTDMTSMFASVTLSIQNYDNLLIGWANLALQKNVIFGAGNSKFSINASDARQHIKYEYNWIITDGGPDNTPTDTSGSDGIIYTVTTDTRDSPNTDTTDDTEDAFLSINTVIFILSLEIIAVFRWKKNRKKIE